MNIKALATPVALVAGLTLGTSAIAQTMVGDVTIADEDMAIVQQHCEDLADARAGGAGEEDADADALEEVQASSIDLSSILIGDCEEAGLLDDYTPNPGAGEDDAMSSDDAMEGDAMEGDAMEGDAMEGDAMEGDAMEGDVE